jgi:hypothetical protein
MKQITYQKILILLSIGVLFTLGLIQDPPDWLWCLELGIIYSLAQDNYYQWKLSKPPTPKLNPPRA